MKRCRLRIPLALLLIAVGLCLLLPALSHLTPASGRAAVTAIVTACDSSEEYVERNGSWRTQYIITAAYTLNGSAYEYQSEPQSKSMIPGSEITLLVDRDNPHSAVPQRIPPQAVLPAGVILTSAGILLLTKPKCR